MDESARLLIQEERMEKITLSQVNATVSHEIRNPINAIHSQNIMLKMLILRISDLLLLLMSPNFIKEHFYERLKKLKEKLQSAVEISVSSE